MKRYKQYSPFVVLEFDADVWEHPVHKHNYYEIIFIGAGEGLHTINDNTFPYKANDVFLLSPEDYHSFSIGQRTSFCFFKFTELVFSKAKTAIEHRKWLEKIEAVIAAPNQLPGAVAFKNNDRSHAEALSRMILNEHHAPSCYSGEIISDCMSTLVSIVARNICYMYNEMGIEQRTDSEQVDKMLTYIRHNVYDAEKISAAAIAREFGMSKNYVGIFFRKNTGDTLQNYILNYKLILAEHRVRHSTFAITDIAYDLGFTDVSHLNKLFKRKYGAAPGQYRKKSREIAGGIAPDEVQR